MANLEFGLIKLKNESVYNLDNINKALNKKGLEQVSLTKYDNMYNDSSFNLEDSNSKDLVAVYYGSDAIKITNALCSFDNKNIYASENSECFKKDYKKFFLEGYISRKDIELSLNNIKENKGYEQTLAIIKPDAYNNALEIIEMIYNNDLKIKDFKIEVLSTDILDLHYSHLKGKSFYPSLIEYMTSGPSVVMILEGVNAVSKYRDLMGSTDSKKALPGTIRNIYGTDIQKNAVHGSDSLENAKIEIERFFKNKTYKKSK